MPTGRFAQDMIGLKFDQLTVIRRAENIIISSCNQRATWLCRCTCGNETVVVGKNLRSGNTKSCGCLRRVAGEDHRSWRGGSRTTAEGYVIVLVGRDHPMSDTNGRCYEHRLVMSDAIGRPLTDDEVVHHINGVRDDNRLENLMLFAGHAEHQAHHQALKRDAVAA